MPPIEKVKIEDYVKRCKMCKPPRYFKIRSLQQHILQKHVRPNATKNYTNESELNGIGCGGSSRKRQGRDDNISYVNIKPKPVSDDDEGPEIKIVSVSDAAGNVFVKTEVDDTDFLTQMICRKVETPKREPPIVTLSSDSDSEDGEFEKTQKIAYPLVANYERILNRTAFLRVEIEPIEASLERYFRGKGNCAENKVRSPETPPSSGVRCRVNDKLKPVFELPQKKLPAVEAPIKPLRQQFQASCNRKDCQHSDMNIQEKIADIESNSKQLHPNVLSSHLQSRDGKSMGILVGAWKIFPVEVTKEKLPNTDEDLILQTHPAIAYIRGLKERDELALQRQIKRESRKRSFKDIIPGTFEKILEPPEKTSKPPEKGSVSTREISDPLERTVESLKKPGRVKQMYEQKDLPSHIHLLEERINNRQIFKCKFCGSRLVHEGQFLPHAMCQKKSIVRPMPKSKKKRYCTCKNTYEGVWRRPMIQCSYCHKWYHGICLGLSDSVLENMNPKDVYECFRCKDKNEDLNNIVTRSTLLQKAKSG